MVKSNTRIRNAESIHHSNATPRSAVSLIVACLILTLALGAAVLGQQTSKPDPNQVAVSLLMVPKDTPTPDPAIPRREIPKLSQLPTLKSTSSPANRLRMLEALGVTEEPTVAVPVNATKLVTLPKLSAMEIADLSARLELHLTTKLGYRATPQEFVDTLPAPPKGIHSIRTLARVKDSTVHVIQFGIQRFVSQPPQCWALGLIVNPDDTLAENPILDELEGTITQMMKSLTELRKGLIVRDLETRIVQLSYVDSKTALSMLTGMGISVFPTPDKIPPKIDFAKLPYVVAIEDPSDKDTGLIGGKSAGGSLGLSLTPGNASDLQPNAIASPMTQLMVMFHPAHPGQFSDVRRMLDTYIDRPARQIFIEGMVLEISEKNLKDLGIDWTLHGANAGYLTLSGGVSEAGLSTNDSTLDVGVSNISSVRKIKEAMRGDFEVNLRALIRDGKAEVLSRPSVLTLNNRQSTIRVGQDIPILSSTEGMSNYSNKLVFKFTYLSTGILLNIRPRINERGTEVSMLIDTIVSAEVPNEELEVLSSDKNDPLVLASAPKISTRRVQTYGRIRNNTPFIIGGLVYREKTSTLDKIPVLGSLPVVGVLFRSEKTNTAKREVIIVLTPYILPEKKLIPRSLPKDEDLFDSFGHKLFRDSYRIRAEDVFDLTFLLENARIVKYRNRARLVVSRNFRLGEAEPFRTFVQDLIPGEPILVTRMIYEVVKRLALDIPVLSDRIIYLQSQQGGGGYNVQFLETFLDSISPKGKFDALKGKAVAITFHGDPSHGGSELDTQSIPEVSVVACADRKAWGKLLWELNQPTAEDKSRHTILIQDQSDVTRLRRACALKKIITLNGGSDQMLLKNFSVGKVLLMPELREDQTHLVDAEAAMFFFYTEHYYAESLKVIEEQLKELDAELKKPEIQTLIESE